MADKRDSITYQINFETSSGHAAIDKLTGALERLGDKTAKIEQSGGNAWMNSLANLAVNTTSAMLSRAAQMSGLPQQANAILDFVGQESTLGMGKMLELGVGFNPMSEIEIENKARQVVTSRQESLGRRYGAGSGLDELREEFRMVREIISRGQKAAKDAEIMIAGRQGGFVDQATDAMSRGAAMLPINPFSVWRRALGFGE